MNRLRATGWLRWSGVVLLLIGNFAYAMTKPLDHNEHMYVSAAILVRHHTLYTDFAFLQMPYFPLLAGGFFSATSTDYFVLWGRIWSWGLNGITAMMLFLLLRKRVRVGWVAWSVFPFFLLNQTVLGVQAESSNYVIPMFASVLAFALITPVLERRTHRSWFSMGAGLALALATGTKLYYLVCFIPFVLVLLVFPRGERERERVVRHLLPFSIGSIIGLLPVVWFLRQDPSAFWFNNIGYHTTNTLWRAQMGHQLGMDMAGKLEFFLLLLFAIPSNLIILGLVVMGLIIALEYRSQPQPRNIWDSLKTLAPTTLLSLLLALITIATLFIPTPMIRQHTAMSIPFVLLFLCGISARIESRAGKRRHTLLLVVLLCVVVGAGASTLRVPLQQFAHLEQWEGIAIHRASHELREVVGEDARIATLSPLYALEANLKIYPELASGPFLYRVGDLLSDPQRVTGTSPTRICALLTHSPPDAILVGFEEEAFLELPLHECAARMGYLPYPRLLRGRGMIYLPHNDSW